MSVGFQSTANKSMLYCSIYPEWSVGWNRITNYSKRYCLPHPKWSVGCKSNTNKSMLYCSIHPKRSVGWNRKTTQSKRYCLPHPKWSVGWKNNPNESMQYCSIRPRWSVGCYSNTNNSNNIYYRAAGGGYFLLIKNSKSKTYINGVLEDVKAEKAISFSLDYSNDSIGALLSSSLFYWSYIAYTDCRNLTKTVIDNFCCPKKIGTDIKLSAICKALFSDYEKNSYKKDTYYKSTGRNVVYWEYYPKQSKSILDKIDKSLASLYNFTEEELDFIINYDIKYRMGDELNSGE